MLETTDSKLIGEWAGIIRRGEDFRKRLYPDSIWRRYEGYFRNNFSLNSSGDEFYDSGGRGSSILADPIVNDEARRQVPKIVPDLPYIKINPLAGRSTMHALVLERVINGILRQIKYKNQLKVAALSAIQHGTSMLKIGYDSQYVPSYKEIMDVGFSEGAFKTKGERQEFRDDIFPGIPWVTWQHPRNVVYPEMTNDFSEARWVAFRYWRQLDDCKSDKRLSNTGDLKAQSYQYSDISPGMITPGPHFNNTKDSVLCTEVRDKESGMMYIFAEDHHKILYKEKDILMAVLGGKLPVHNLVFNGNTDYAWGTSDIDLVEVKLRELLDVRSQRAKNRRLSVAKFLFRKGVIKSGQLSRLVSATVGAGVEVNGNLQTDIMPFQMPNSNNLDGDIVEIEQAIKRHFGSAAFDTHAQSRRGGAEVSGSQGDAMVPVNDRRDIVNDMTVDIAKDIANMIFTFWTEETVVDILSPVTQKIRNPETGQIEDADVTRQVWVTFKGRELRGDFDYSVTVVGSKEEDMAKKKQESMMLAGFGEQVQASGGDFREFNRQLLAGFPQFDIDRIFPPVNSAQNPMSMGQMDQMGQQQQQRRLA